MYKEVNWPISNIRSYFSCKPLDFASHTPLLPIQAHPITLTQVHKNTVQWICSKNDTGLTGDAMITDSENIALVIRTADCLPVLLSSVDGECIAAIHAGWRSLQQNIIESTLEVMHAKGVSDWIAWLGPCICPLHFEVGSDVFHAFCDNEPHLAPFFSEGTNNKWHADLKEMASAKLQKFGVDVIKVHDDCTACDSSQYYSYRKNKDLGRMASIVVKIAPVPL